MPMVMCSTVEKRRRVFTGCAVARLSRGQTENDQHPLFFHQFSRTVSQLITILFKTKSFQLVAYRV